MRHAGIVGGNTVGLLVVDHLDAMFDTAQEMIGPRKILHRLGRHAPDVVQSLVRHQRRGDAHARVAPAEDQLLGLGEELDLADAAAADRDVVAVDRHLAVALVGVDLALDRMDVLDGGEIQVAAPDEGLQEADEGCPRLRVAGDRAGLDHRRALPVLADAAVINFGRRHGNRQRRGAWVRPKPKVGSEDVAVLGPFIHNADKIACEPDESSREVVRLGRLHNSVVVQDDQVDVAGIVEFAPAKLAHAQHDQT